MVDTAVFCFVKANPPTRNHQNLFAEVYNTAQKLKGHSFIFLSHQYEPKKNPLSWEFRLNYLHSLYKDSINIVNDINAKTLISALEFLYSHQYTKVVFITGSNTLGELKNVIETYNGKETTKGFYKFNSIKVISAGMKDPDADEDINGFSPSSARNAVMDRDYNLFKKIVLAPDNSYALSLYSQLSKEMGLKEKVYRIKIKR